MYIQGLYNLIDVIESRNLYHIDNAFMLNSVDHLYYELIQ